MTGTQPLRLELFPSRRMAVLILAAYMTAAASFLTALTGWHGIVLALLTMTLGGFAAWDRALLRSTSSPRCIEIFPTGEARCQFADAESANLHPLGGNSVTRYWVSVRLQSRRRASLFVAAGMLAPEPLRLLRLWALWGRLPGVTRRQLTA